MWRYILFLWHSDLVLCSVCIPFGVLLLSIFILFLLLLFRCVYIFVFFLLFFGFQKILRHNHCDKACSVDFFMPLGKTGEMASETCVRKRAKHLQPNCIRQIDRLLYVILSCEFLSNIVANIVYWLEKGEFLYKMSAAVAATGGLSHDHPSAACKNSMREHELIEREFVCGKETQPRM